MKTVSIVLLLAVVLSALCVSALDAQGNEDQWQDSPLTSPLPLIRIERQELMPIYQRIYWGEDGKLHYSGIWY